MLRTADTHKMKSLDAFKSAISIGNVDDTSLALPSGNHHRSGQERVLEQVQTVRRTKSRQCSSRSGSTSLSPTSPSHDSVFTDGVKSNGSVFFSNGFSKNAVQLGLEKSRSRQIIDGSKGSSGKRMTATSAYHYERGYVPFNSVAKGRINTSHSEPDLAVRRSMLQQSVPRQRIVSNKGSYMTQRSTSQFLTSTGSQPQPLYSANGHVKTKNQFICSQTGMRKTQSKPSVTESKTKSIGSSGMNGHSGVANITLKEAVEFLSSGDEKYQHCGASHIQHNAFVEDKAKEEILKLKGIPPLVGLLRSSSSQVSHTASAALRNLSFKNDRNKEEIHRCGGIEEAVSLLRESDSVELNKQLTGLLWNLSSAEELRSDLLKSALPVLVERVVVPYTAGPNQINGTNKDLDVFYHTTGCLRNLSSAQQFSRQTMRKCPGLIDSLVTYIKNCVDSGKSDDESVENCACILHNLTFQLEAEVPTLFNQITALSQPVNRSQSQSNSSPVGCFSSQSKAVQHEHHFDFPVPEDPRPNGAGWLIHSNTLQSYLSLLGSSQREETLEACCGTLKNLTAHEGIVSNVMSQIIVQKVNGLQFISPHLRSKRINLQRNTVALVGNLAKNPNLHSAIGRKALPELLGLLGEGTKGSNESDDTLSMACQSVSCLILKEPELSKPFLNNKVIDSLYGVSKNPYFPKSSKSAALLLYKMWSDKDLQSFLKKQGMSKSSFVNDVTTAAHRSVQVVD